MAHEISSGPSLRLGDMMDLGGDFFCFPCEQQLIRRYLCEEARWKLDALIPPGHRARIHTVVTAGRAVDEIVRTASEQHADLILLGGRGRRGWRHLLRRTMADRVRRKARIPVVTLDANDLRVGQDLGFRGVPDQRIGSERGRRQADRRSRATRV
jgi:Universal stress protein family